MEDKFLFRLTPAYCLFNGMAIKNQNGCEITFAVENVDDEVLQGRLRRAFFNHLNYVKELSDCPELYKRLPKIEFSAAKRSEIRSYISRMYKNDDSLSLSESMEGSEEQKKTDEAAAVLLLDTILNEARDKGASDIHIEKGRIRFRICGKLIFYMTLQNERSDELVQRIKILAGMNVIDKRMCQDGQFVYGTVKPLFIRVSSMPIYNENLRQEESLVMRLLDVSRVPLELPFLGFSESQLEKIEVLETMKNGLILVCGPTGSGKSTTVASILMEIEKKNFGEKKIISLEDPPEYVIPDVCQIKVTEDAGRFATAGELKNQHYGQAGGAFGNALMHVFRQDPDIVMIGEIRDELTAQTAVRAAMTGHLVFATLHTGSAASAVLRLEDLGVERSLLCSVIRGIICQELEFMDSKTFLFADVALPAEGFDRNCKENLTEAEIDELFIHENNYMKSFSKSMKVMANGYKKGLPVLRLWNGEIYGKKVHRFIG